jgi:hypothetical protein
MADDKKSMERRLQMIKRTVFFKKRKNIVLLLGILCIVLSGGLLLTSRLAPGTGDIDRSKLTKLILHVSPGQYTLAMSSTPGIGILPEYEGGAATVRYSTDRGAFFTWEKMQERKARLELAYGQKVYWSPLLDENSTMDSGKITIKAELLDDRGKLLKEKKIEITGENSIYRVMPEEGIYIESAGDLDVQKPQSLEEAVAQAVKGRKASYLKGEAAAEGHLIIAAQEKEGRVIAYTLASYGSFGFENGIFTKISGSGAIPTVISFARDEKGQLTLLDYQEPMDGSYYGPSVKKMFPGELLQKLKAAEQKIPQLLTQQEEQASAYLRSIGRSAEVDANPVEKQLGDINVEAANKLFSELPKYDEFLNSCPYWIGTRETIENGVRYIYEKSQGKTEDGYDLVTYRKTDSSGRLIQERKYKIVGNEPQLMP